MEDGGQKGSRRWLAETTEASVVFLPVPFPPPWLPPPVSPKSPHPHTRGDCHYSFPPALTSDTHCTPKGWAVAGPGGATGKEASSRAQQALLTGEALFLVPLMQPLLSPPNDPPRQAWHPLRTDEEARLTPAAPGRTSSELRPVP
jgi:hypothetical protein